jgi:hypothetical protein
MSDEAAHQRLLAAIGAALGQPGPYAVQIAEREDAIHLGTGSSPPIGEGREVLGGAIEEHTGRVAWIEQRSEAPHGGYVPVEIDLRWAADGALRGVEEVPTYNPYFGCRVEFAAWVAGGFVYAYHEKHRFVLARLDPRRFDEGGGGQRLLGIETPAQVHAGVLWHVDTDDGVLLGRSLATLEPTIPVLVPRDDDRRHPAELFVRDTGELAFGYWDERARVEGVDAWAAENDRARQHALDHAVTLALPPVEREHPSAELVRACLERAALSLGLPPRDFEPIAEPWLTPDQPAAGYAGLRRPSWSAAETRLSPAARERLASLDDDRSPVAWGWPGLTVADDLEAILRDRLRIGARRCRADAKPPTCG